MADIIKFKRGNGQPPSLNEGEPAVDLKNKKIYIGGSDGSPFEISGDIDTSSLLTKNEAESTYVKKTDMGSVYKFNGTLPVSSAEEIIADGHSLSVGTVYNIASNNGRFNGDEMAMPFIVFHPSQLLLCNLDGGTQYIYCGIEIKSPVEFLNSIDNYGIDTNNPIIVFVNGTEISGTFVAIEDGIIKFQTDTIPYEHIEGVITYAILTPTIKLYENDNIAWTGVYWDKLGSSFDTSIFAKKNEVNTQIDEEKERLERLHYYGDMNIIPADESYFNITDDGELSILDSCTLTEIVIPYKIGDIEVRSIGCINERGNSSVEKVIIPNSVTSINHDAFRGSPLKEINIPDSVTSIQDYAFFSCTSLKEINIPDSVTSIQEYAFFSCTSLKEINIPNGVTNLNYTFFNCTSLKEITIPDSVTRIGFKAFYGCTSLKEITIPDSVTSINLDAFYSNSDDGIMSGLTIICNQDSYAETFARKNFVKYRSRNGKNFCSAKIRENVISIQISEDELCKTETYLTYIDLFDDNEMIFSETPTSRTRYSEISLEEGVEDIEEITYRNEFAINIPDNIDFGYEAYLSFPVGDTVPTIQYPAGIIFKGVDCDNEGNFTPVANTNYEIAFKYMGVDTDEIPIIVARVGSW